MNWPSSRNAERFLCVGGALLALLLAGTALGAPAPVDTSRTAPTIKLRLPPDITYTRAGRPDSAVIFSHRTHFALAGNRCTGCHPGAFRMLQRGPVPHHGEMNTGKSCGRCHDGKQAFGVRDPSACLTCHAGTRPEPPDIAAADESAGGTAAPTRLPGPHAYPRSEDSPGSVTFRHKTHASDASGCAACHPKPFRMAAVPPLPMGGMHERQACGACHDGAKAFAADDSETCSRCHRESGGRP